jgi:hypothetical protein
VGLGSSEMMVMEFKNWTYGRDLARNPSRKKKREE